MTTVFVGGSRRITRLPVQARVRIDNVLEKGFAIVVGDASGADKAVQKHLAEAKYDKVTVYFSGDTSRNNLGQWETRSVKVGERKKNFQYYAAKDREMAQQAEFGLMIWDGKSLGTVLNILRLVRASKKAVLVSVAEKSEVEFKGKGDWDAFLSGCSSKLLRDMERRATQDELFMLRRAQDELNFGNADESPDGGTAWGEWKLKMEAALADGDSKGFVELLGGMARQRGMTRVARETGLAREALYRALSSGGNPEFATIVRVTGALGLQLSASRKAEGSTAFS